MSKSEKPHLRLVSKKEKSHERKPDKSKRRLNALIDDLVQQESAEKLMAVSALNHELEDLLTAEKRIKELSDDVKSRAMTAIQSTETEVMENSAELFKNPQLKITFIQNLINEVKKARTFSRLITVTKKCIKTGLLTAQLNGYGEPVLISIVIPQENNRQVAAVMKTLANVISRKRAQFSKKKSDKTKEQEKDEFNNRPKFRRKKNRRKRDK